MQRWRRGKARTALALLVFLLTQPWWPASKAGLALAQDGQEKQKRVYTNDDWPFNLPRQLPSPSGDRQSPQEPSSAAKEEGKKIAPYVPTPTPMAVVEKMLEVAGVTAEDVVYDLGSGDGRVVVLAAQKYGAKSVGVELDQGLARESTEKVQELKLESLVTIIEGDLLKTDLKPATVVTIYLMPAANDQLRPIFEKELSAGSRVVSHDWLIYGWEADREEAVQVNGATHFVYLFRVPDAFRR